LNGSRTFRQNKAQLKGWARFLFWNGLRERITQTRLIRVELWRFSRLIGGPCAITRTWLDVWIIRDEIRLRGMTGVLVLPRHGLLVMGSVERIDTHESPPVEP
jgi:hypothetical protein